MQTIRIKVPFFSSKYAIENDMPWKNNYMNITPRRLLWRKTIAANLLHRFKNKRFVMPRWFPMLSDLNTDDFERNRRQKMKRLQK